MIEHTVRPEAVPFEPGRGAFSPVRRSADQGDKLLMLFVLAHIPLALWIRESPDAVIAIGMLTLGIGVGSALFGSRSGSLPMYCSAYMMGFECVYRTTEAYSPLLRYEFAKYSVIVMLGIGVFRWRKSGRLSTLPITYGLLLLPSTIFALLFSMSIFELGKVHRLVSGTLSGPCSLMVCALYFSQCVLSRRKLHNLVLVALASISVSGVFGIYNVVTLGDAIRYGQGSNLEASGGGGPNQVSNTLAIGAALCWLILLGPALKLRQRIFYGGTLLALLVPMLFTFSRGGVYSLLLVVVTTFVVAFRTRRFRTQTLVVACVLGLLVILIVWPALNRVTAGSATERYSDLQDARWGLAIAELKVWAANPLLGAGPGLGRYEVKQYLGRVFTAHVEFTRLLADHGMFGLLAMIVFFLGFVRNYRAARSDWKLWVLGLMVFTCAYWGQAATRTLGQGFMYGLLWAKLAVWPPVLGRPNPSKLRQLGPPRFR